MAKISDCSYMEIKKIYSWNIDVVGKKALCTMILTDTDKYRNPKKITVSLSNLYPLMTLFGVKSMIELIGVDIKCLIHEKFREITFIGPLDFNLKDIQANYIRCNQVHLDES